MTRTRLLATGTLFVTFMNMYNYRCKIFPSASFSKYLVKRYHDRFTEPLSLVLFDYIAPLAIAHLPVLALIRDYQSTSG